MEQEQTNVNVNQANTNDNFQVTFDFAKTPITQIADYIIIAASKHNTSDIHFDPRENGMMVRFRIDGDLQDYSFIPKAYERNLTTRLKLLANMNITESRLPQDGAIKGMFGDTYLDMRVSCLPLNEGEKIVIRILDYTRSLQGIDSLGFHPDNLVKLKRMMGAPNGIILTTGATGSGKSTTTYSILQGLNTPETNIITVEDPIEMNIQGINQVQVNSEIGMTFAAALRSILRQDPNVILIGEIRDSETAQIAVRSAITGHLVLSTIHTNNSLSTIERLMDMDVERYLLSTALVGIISQRLAKGICPKCRFQRKTTPYEQKIFRNFLRLDVKTIWDANPKGCPNCRKGYKGRIAIQEVLELDDDIRTALNNPKLSKEELRSMVYTDKTITMLQDALIKCINGETNFEEVYRVIEMENDDEEDYSAELTAVIEDAQNGKPLGIDGADILDSLKNAPIDSATTNTNVVVEQQVPAEGLPNVVDNLQQSVPNPEPIADTTQNSELESEQEQISSSESQPVTQQEQAIQPTDQYITNTKAERQDELPEIVQSLPSNSKEENVVEEQQNSELQQVQPQATPTTNAVENAAQDNPLNVAIVDQPMPEPIKNDMPITTAVENAAQDNPLNVAIVDQPMPEPIKNDMPITTAVENAAPNAPLEVTLVEEPKEALSQEVIEVPIVEPTEELRVIIPTYEEVKAIEEQQRLEKQQQLEEQKRLEEQQRLENIESSQNEEDENEEEKIGEEQPILVTQEDITEENQIDNSLEETDVQIDEESNNDDEAPLSDEVVDIPSVMDESIEQNEEKIINSDLSQTDENNDDYKMFDGNVLVGDDGAIQQEEYSIFDFRNNQPMTFDENDEPILKPLRDDIQIVPEAQEEVKEENIQENVSEIDVDTEKTDIENRQEIIDAPDPNYEINYENIGITDEDNEDEDKITRTIEYDDNIVEIADTSYEIKTNNNIDNKFLEKEDNENCEDVNEEYNPDLINNKDDTQESEISIDDIATVADEEFNKNLKSDNNLNSMILDIDNNSDIDLELGNNNKDFDLESDNNYSDLSLDINNNDSEVNLDDIIYIDSKEEDIDKKETREPIGSDFVDKEGPLLEEIPRLGTETEEIEEDLQFDPNAFENE